MYASLEQFPALQRQNAENLKQIFPEKEYRGLSPNFHIHVSVSELYIPTMGLPVLLEEICRLILGIYKSQKNNSHDKKRDDYRQGAGYVFRLLIYSIQRHMNVEIGAEAALFPEKEYINGIAVAVCLIFRSAPNQETYLSTCSCQLLKK